MLFYLQFITQLQTLTSRENKILFNKKNITLSRDKERLTLISAYNWQSTEKIRPPNNLRTNLLHFLKYLFLTNDY
jgi:hypothetical protein